MKYYEMNGVSMKTNKKKPERVLALAMEQLKAVFNMKFSKDKEQKYAENKISRVQRQ